MQKDRPLAAPSHLSDARIASPIRSPEGQLYSLPAATIRSRSAARPYHVAPPTEDFSRQRDRGHAASSPRDVDVYRTSRPSVVYPSDPRHSNAAIDYGDDGYQYTNAGDLVRYDLDHGVPGPTRSRRHESFDKGYHRPNISYNSDQRSFNVNTSHEAGRNYNMNTGRHYEGRSGRPPSTHRLDKTSRGYETTRDVPPAVPAPPAPTPATQLDVGRDRREGRRSRPVSLTQDSIPRSADPEDYYRSREGDYAYDGSRFQDDRVTSRGFGIRTSPVGQPEELRDRYKEPRRDELRREDLKRENLRGEEPRQDEARRDDFRKDGLKRADEETTREQDFEREDRYRGRQDASIKEDARDRREGRKGDDIEERDRSRVRDKLATGLGIAAAAVGLAPSGKRDDWPVADSKEARSRRNPEESGDRRGGAEDRRHISPDASREKRRNEDRERSGDRTDAEARERHRRDTEAKLNGDVLVTASDSEDGRRAYRRQRPSGTFNPNDAGDLRQLQEEIAALSTSERDRERVRSVPGAYEKASRSPSPVESKAVEPLPKDESRGRELVVPATEIEKQVRVVSPPRDKREDRPLKGILKQPRNSFPEERNSAREGVAPHKDDKKMKDAPTGAKWTKINRKIVNPEALTIGKERFEVRDDFVIVLRVLSKEEIQAYASATQVLRGKHN